MNSELFVSVSVLTQFPKVQAFLAQMPAEDKDALLLDVCEESRELVVDTNNKRVRPNFQLARNMVLLRNIPTGTEPQIVQSFLSNILIPSKSSSNLFKSIKGDIADTWYVEMADDATAAALVNVIRMECPEWGGAGSGRFITGRIKTESLLKNTSRPSSVSPLSASTLGNSSSSNYYNILGSNWTQPPPQQQQQRYHTTKQKAFYSSGRQQVRPLPRQQQPQMPSPLSFNHQKSFSSNNNKYNNGKRQQGSNITPSSSSGSDARDRKNRPPNNNNKKTEAEPPLILIKDEINFPSLSSNPTPSLTFTASTFTAASFADIVFKNTKKY